MIGSSNEQTNLEMSGSLVLSYPQNFFGTLPFELSNPPPARVLSRRQQEVLTLLIRGSSNKEIARSLNLGLGTVKIHVAALFVKFGVRRRATLAVMGARLQ
jgi:DNA-binding NarL/FixJ family response regulator